MIIRTIIAWFIFIFFVVNQSVMAQDASLEIEKSRSYYKQGMMTSSLKSGASALDLIAQRISGKLYAAMPEPTTGVVCRLA